MMNEQIQNEFNLKMTIWEREIEIEVVFDCYTNETITASQNQAYLDFLSNNKNFYSISKRKILDYVTQDIEYFPDKIIPENIFKFIMPKAIFIKRDSESNKLFGLLFHYKYREEEGICVVFKNNDFFEIGPENIIL